jgi:chromodomain-helicase-DNA-binding protein 4
MGKEEDVDVDSMLLHGARALFEDDHHGDVVYTSENVDELIDRVEADAEAQVMGEGEPHTKEAMAFDFAKVWEVRKGSSELVEQEAETEEESQAFWANVTRNAEAARKKQEADRNSRRAKMKPPKVCAIIHC